MNRKRRLLALMLVIVFSAVVLTSCGGSKGDKNKGSGDTQKSVTPTDAPTPSPTEAPKTPEQLDLDAIELIFQAAAETASDPANSLGEGTRFLLNFDGENISLELETKNEGYKRRIWESWIRGAGLSKSTYPLQSESYRENSRYGTVTGVLDDTGKIQWMADNLDDGLFAALGRLGVEKDPAFLTRMEMYGKVNGEWYGEVQMDILSLVEQYIDDNDELGRDYYRNLIRFLKNYGFSGKIQASASCTFLNEKELRFQSGIDWTGFLDALHKAASTKESMTKFICVVGNISESTLNAMLKQKKTDVMTFGKLIVVELEALCKTNVGEDFTSKYNWSGNELYFYYNNYPDKLTYNSGKETMTYSDSGIDVTLKKK